ncbi:hypothetical protein H8356DRAFT_1386389 [Neocallimastix lanati (nom. inval.)]|nr:hypothetical protein H8356DRAFT_1386389 [Neocallimastix sp. JGI-2020a]
MTYPDINNLHSLREFTEIYTNNPLIEENVHMKRYQILPVRYMSPENEVVNRFLIYHSPGTGKSFTALWIALKFINVYKKPCIILVKGKEAITEFTKRVKTWYDYTFEYYPHLPNVKDYKEFIKKYIEFRTYITFCNDIKNINDSNTDTDGNDNKSDHQQTTSNSFSFYDERLIIIDEVHHFRNPTKKKFIYNNLSSLLNHINKGRIIFMSATPIFDNANEITDLVKLIKPNLNSTSFLTPEKLKEEMLGHLSYYGLNPPNTTVNYMGSYIPGIERYKIVKVPMQGVQLQNYRNILKEPQEKNNMGINYVKATLGVLHLQIDDNLTQDTNKGSKEKGKSNDTKKGSKAKGKSNDAKKRSKSKVKSDLSEYQFSNDKIIHSNPHLQDIIMQQSKDIKNYCCKLYHCLNEINKKENPDGPVFIYCSIIEQVGIYYFSAILCAMGYHYVYNKISSNSRHNDETSNFSNLESKVDRKGKGIDRFLPHHFSSFHDGDVDDDNEFAELKEIRKEREDKFWNFTFITGDKKLCPNMMERLDMFNDSSNQNGSKIKVLLGSDIVSESVDIMNVRQLHILTPHWNYEKINQIIGRIRRVGSHDSLPENQRFVNVYLYMAYDDEVECSDSYQYSVDYRKYILCENKYKDALKFNQALKNASIEFLIHAPFNLNDSQNTNGLSTKEQNKPFDIESSLSESRAMTNTSIAIDANIHGETSTFKDINGNEIIGNTSIVPYLHYSSVYLDKLLPLCMIEINKKLSTFFSENNCIRIMDLMDRIPNILNSNNIVIAGGILRYSDGMIYRKIISNYRLNYRNAYFGKLLRQNLPFYNNNRSRTNERTVILLYSRIEVDIKSEEIVSLNNKLQNADMTREAYNQIIKYSHTEKLFILRYALRQNLFNITKLFYPYWKKIDNFIYISYFSTIKTTSYASNKKKSVNDFSTNIIYADFNLREWKLVNEELNSENISKQMDDHYSTEEGNRTKDRYKYVYMLCNDLTLRYCDLKKNLNFNFKKQKRSTSKRSTSKRSTSKRSTSDSGSINFREVNRGRNIESFYIKQELLEKLIYSICYDDMEKKLSSIRIPNSQETSIEKMEKIYKEENNKDKYKEIKKHILSVVTQNDIPKYCNERPHQAFLLHELLISFSKTMKKTRKEMIELWKKYLFDYDLIIIL